MSHKVLARKWRPHHFRDMLGQEAVLRALTNALDSDRLHHAYLFTGMRGVGKTTIARIFAKCLNCETNGVSSDPCGTCSACVDIDAGRFFDLIEVDAASRTKVEGTRELLENVPYAPASGRFKVYLIDEVHMFSTHSFNALLKTLEEPPEHVKFLLATTDPQKVPATVLSRCLQFNLKRMATSNLSNYLSTILKAEDIEHELPALELIARASEGSVRDALSLVEQAIASGAGTLQADVVENMLGRASVDRLLLLTETLASGNLAKLFEQIDELATYAPDFSELLGEILSLLHRVAMLQSVPQSIAETAPGYDRLVELANSVDADSVQLFYQIGLHARRDMPFAPDAREAFDMALLRMHSFRPQDDAMPLLSESPAISSVSSGSGESGGSSASKGSPASQGSSASKGSSELPTAGNEKRTTGLPVRGEVSAGLSAREAALAAARGELTGTDGQSPAAPPANKTRPTSTTRNPAASDAPPTQAQTHEARGQATLAAEPNATEAPSTDAPASQAPTSQASESQAQTPATQAPATQARASQTPAAQNSRTDAPAAEAPATETSAIAPHIADPQTADTDTHVALTSEAPAPGPLAPEVQPQEVSALDKSAITAGDWPQLTKELDIAGMPLQLARNCAWVGITGDAITLQIEQSSEHLLTDRFSERVQTALSAWFGRPVSVSIEQIDGELNTPTRIAEQQSADDMAAAHDSIKFDPIVKQLIEKVDGAVDEASIKPVGGSVG